MQYPVEVLQCTATIVQSAERKGRRGCWKTPNHFEIEEFIPQGIKVSLI